MACCCCKNSSSPAGMWIAISVAIAAGTWTAVGGGDKPASAPAVQPAAAGSPLDFTMNRIDGATQALSEYKGKVVLMVNVASQCGLTPQYEALEALYKSKKDAGLVVLGFPANNFGGQEPGTNSEIAQFCTAKFGVSFPMFEKISVKGEDQHPLYKMLSSLPAPLGGDPKWNFTKFVIDRSGKVVARFEPKTKPDDPALIAQIDALLSEKP